MVGGREQDQRLAVRVELELVPGVVADADGRSWIAREVEVPLRRHVLAVDAVRRTQGGLVGEDARAHEPHRGVDEGIGAQGQGRQPRVALVADPGVAVVVVTTGLRTLGQRGGGRRHHAALGAGQSAQDRPGVQRLPGGGRAADVGARVGPTALGDLPSGARVGRHLRQPARGDLEDQVVVLARGDRQVGAQAPADDPGALGRAAPAIGQPTGASLPDTVGTASEAHHPAPETRAAVQLHVDVCRPLHRLDATQQHHPVRVPGEGQRLAALDHRARGDPAASPDQAAVLVVAAPDVVAVHRGDGVAARATEQGGEDGVVVPMRGAQEGDVTVWADECATLPVGEERVLTQRLGWKVCTVHGTRFRSSQVAPPSLHA